jgi:hypothetical protein
MTGDEVKMVLGLLERIVVLEQNYGKLEEELTGAVVDMNKVRTRAKTYMAHEKANEIAASEASLDNVRSQPKMRSHAENKQRLKDKYGEEYS